LDLGLPMIKLAITPILATILIVTTGSYALAGQIKGKQYVTKDSGAVPLADNEIIYLPCAPLNKTCKVLSGLTKYSFGDLSKQINADILSQLGECKKMSEQSQFHCFSIVKELVETDAKIFEDAVNDAEKQYKNNSLAKVVRTDFEGNYSFDCPTQNCLIFSKSKTNNKLFSWIEIVAGGQQFDLSQSKSFFTLTRLY
jgi:hypothetical protein